MTAERERVESRSPEGTSIRCRRCGGAFGFLPRSGSARCPYCNHEQLVSPELLAELGNYGGAVHSELARADAAYQRAAAWSQWTDLPERRGPRVAVVVAVASGLTLLVCLAVPVSQWLGMPANLVGAIASPLLSAPGTLLFGYVIWRYSGLGRPARRAVAGRISVACPTCGAMAALDAGAAAQVCGYCGSALVASPAVIRQGIDAAGLEYRRARLEELRQERLGMVSVTRYDMTAYVPYIVAGSLGMMLGGGSIAFTFAMLAGSEPYSPAIFVLWFGFFGVLVFALGTAWHRRSRRGAYRRVLADIAHQFPTEPISELDSVVDWLNRYWPVKYDVADLTRGIFAFGARFDVHGYPALLHCNPSPLQGRKPFLHLLVSAHRPPSAAGEAAAHDVIVRCRGLGFHVALNEGGLFGTADDALLGALARSPDVVHQIAPVLTAMVEAARLSGAVPATP